MITILYLTAALFAFAILSESESNAYKAALSQRQLLIVLCSCVVWPLLALGLAFEKRREIFENFRVLCDLELDINQILMQLNPHPEMFEDLDDEFFEVDHDTE
jgi:hypothetical protein